MKTFEDRLREQLREAAEDAPPFHGMAPVESPAVRRPHTHRLATAAVAVVVAGAAIGVGWQVLPGGSGGHSGGGAGASCAMTLTFRGATYVLSGGDQVRTPRRGALLGTGVIPGCLDSGPNHPQPSEHRRVYAIPGVSPQRAIIDSEGLVLVPNDATAVPAALREIYQPVACNASGTISGHLTGETPGRGVREGSDRVKLPYTASFDADRGTIPALKQYANVRITVRVTDATTGGRDAALTRAALQDSKRLTVTVRCDGSRFVATALRPAAK